ncbi:MAG: CRTAC1 family protein [Lentisphaerae bacterium]|jgi:enediyne biosynthesis protein E4|nr:CRTAC1 family protein [Lentisphaerota bacterium]MBT4818934.1 CRTAC1 family protein [Lentisphaerota bacterium]MBT5608232.1 CRTAC1 family protein [Lentisphaerota bacterium]MBT7058879.1 CRTAC1 family protein [Lentisphaerota bacterium]MBT7842890.1 CRTAC1 family protein [Lentisphaerota bacterium]
MLMRWVSVALVCGFVACAAPPSSTDLPAGAFKDVTAEIGLAGMQAGRTCAWADYNNDGWVDVLVAGTLFRNDRGTFEAVTMPKECGEGVWADIDNDGRLDIVTVKGKGAVLRNTGDGFELLHTIGIPQVARPRAACADADNDGRLDMFITNYETKFGGPIYKDFLFMSQPDGSFGPAVTLTDACWTARGANWADFDNDGDQDLYVSNYRLMPNALWVNDGAGTFVEQAKARGVYGVATAGKERASKYYPAYEYTGHTIGSCWGDLNNDGNIDLVVVNFSHPPKWQNRVEICINSGPPSYTFTNRNKGDAGGVYWQESYAKGALGDYDNDGDLDLYLTTVYPRDKGELFQNHGDGSFKAVGKQFGLRTPHSYHVAWADIDNDGDLDLMSSGKLFRNPGFGSCWLKVRVEGGVGSNRAAIGARVTVVAGERKQIREISGGNSGNQNPLLLHVGLGNWLPTKQVDVEVRFPSGKCLATQATPCSTITVSEKDAVEPPLR